MDLLSHFFKINSSYLDNDEIYISPHQDEDLYYNLNNNDNFNNNTYLEFHFDSNRANDVFNLDNLLQQNNGEILFCQNFPNEERTFENPDDHEINNYYLSNYSNYIPEGKLNEDLDNVFFNDNNSENNLSPIIQINSNNRNNNINQEF